MSDTDENNLFYTSKLLRHLDRLGEWQRGGDVKPLLVGLALTNLCNHRCPACNGAPGLLGPDNTALPFEMVTCLIGDLKAFGVKAVTLGGGGDPTCYPRLAEVLYRLKAAGIESGIYTNGQLVRGDLLEAIVACCTWVRVSLDADGPEIFARTHGVSSDSWNKVLSNTSALVKRKNETGSSIVIGTSLLLGSDTKPAIYGAARIARDLGVSYIRMRPFFTWDGKLPFSQDEAQEILDELARARELETPGFSVSYPAARTEWVLDGSIGEVPRSCHIHHFITHIQPDGKVYLCCHNIDRDKYALGDLHRNSLSEIWASEQRRRVHESIDFRECATPCQMVQHNKLLDKLATPFIHENFI